MEQTPNYIKTLLIPHNGGKPQGRKVWSVDLETVWLPFFTATNVMGDTHIPVDALGAPLRLAYNADGSIKFSKTSRPIVRVAKDLSDAIRLARENFVATLQNYATTVAKENEVSWSTLVATAKRAGEPILNNDGERLKDALAQMLADSIAQAQAEAEAKKRTAEPEAVAVPPEPEAVAVAEVPKGKGKHAIEPEAEKMAVA